jgi:uncharacterized membrane protein
MKLHQFRFLIIAVIVTILAASPACLHDNNIESYPSVSFFKEVQPIIAANCTKSGCHGSENTSEFQLLSYTDIIGHVSPGNGRKSSLYRVITGREFEYMPPSPADPLTEDQIRSIFMWIEQGAPNN